MYNNLSQVIQQSNLNLRKPSNKNRKILKAQEVGLYPPENWHALNEDGKIRWFLVACYLLRPVMPELFALLNKLILFDRKNGLFNCNINQKFWGRMIGLTRPETNQLFRFLEAYHFLTVTPQKDRESVNHYTLGIWSRGAENEKLFKQFFDNLSISKSCFVTQNINIYINIQDTLYVETDLCARVTARATGARMRARDFEVQDEVPNDMTATEWKRKSQISHEIYTRGKLNRPPNSGLRCEDVGSFPNKPQKSEGNDMRGSSLRSNEPRSLGSVMQAKRDYPEQKNYRSPDDALRQARQRQTQGKTLGELLPPALAWLFTPERDAGA